MGHPQAARQQSECFPAISHIDLAQNNFPGCAGHRNDIKNVRIILFLFLSNQCLLLCSTDPTRLTGQASFTADHFALSGQNGRQRRFTTAVFPGYGKMPAFSQ